MKKIFFFLINSENFIGSDRFFSCKEDLTSSCTRFRLWQNDKRKVLNKLN